MQKAFHQDELYRSTHVLDTVINTERKRKRKKEISSVEIHCSFFLFIFEMCLLGRKIITPII